MKALKRKVAFGVLFVALALTLATYANYVGVSRDIQLAGFDKRAGQCANVFISTANCPVCSTVNLPQGYKDTPTGFPFKILTGSLCPGSPDKDAEILNVAVAATTAAILTTGLYFAYAKLRKGSRNGK